MAGKLKDLYVKRNQNQYQPAADSWEARAAELSNMSGGAMPQGETAGNGALGWLKDSADAGFFNTLGGTARLAGEFMPFGNDTFNSWADKADEIARRNSPQPGQNLEGIDYIASAVGNALGSGGASALEAGVVAGIGSLLGVGGVAGAALGGASKVIPGVGKAVQAGKTLWGSPVGKYLVANVAGSPFEAGSEAGNLISDMRKENQQGTANYTDDEIRDAALRSGALNLAWLTGMNMLEAGTLGKITGALGGDMAAKGVKDIAKRATLGGLSSGIGEGAEEYGQNLIGDYSKRGSTADFNYDEAMEAAKMGAIGGGVLGGLGSGLSAKFSKKNSDVSEEIASEDGGTIEEAPEANVSGREAFINAIAGQESGGNYNAENSDTGAYGKYQIMPSNWPAWAEEAGIGADAPRTPENQEIVARFKLGQYYDKYGARGAAIAWYGGEGALNYSEEALNRKQGDNGEYPSINEYADEVLGRMGNVADSVRIDDTEENYFDESNYTDDTIPDSLNPVRGFDVSHLDKGTAQDRNSLLYGERVKKAKPAPAGEEVASFNQSLDNSNAQKAPNSLFANPPRSSWDAAARIYKARAKEQAERKARAQAITNIINARAAQKWDNAEQLHLANTRQSNRENLGALVPVNNAVAPQMSRMGHGELTLQNGRAQGLTDEEQAIINRYQGNPDAFNRKFKESVESVQAAVQRGDITQDVGRAYLKNLANMYDTVIGPIQNNGVIMQGQDAPIRKLVNKMRAKRKQGEVGTEPSLLQENGRVKKNAPADMLVKTSKGWDKAEAEYKARAEEKVEKHTRQQTIADIVNARAAQKWDEAEQLHLANTRQSNRENLGALVPVNNAVAPQMSRMGHGELTLQNGRAQGLTDEEQAIINRYQGNPDAFNRKFKESVESVQAAVQRGDITQDVGRAYLKNLANMYDTVIGPIQNNGVIMQGQDAPIRKLVNKMRAKRKQGEVGTEPSLLQENGRVKKNAPADMLVKTSKGWDKAEAEYKARAEEKVEKHTRQQTIADIVNARAAQKWDEAETEYVSSKKGIDITLPKGVTAKAEYVTNKKTGKQEVELKFSGEKISDEFKKKLRAHGFNWNVGRKAWVAEENIITKAVAEKLTQKENVKAKEGNQAEKTTEPAQDKADSVQTKRTKAKQAIDDAPKGKTVEATTDNGVKFGVQYAIVPADSLITSNNASDFSNNEAYPQELQPRDRNRAYMRLQVEKMSGTIEPERITTGTSVNEGAPIVNKEGVVENGNGRTMALVRMWRSGNKKLQKAYRDYLAKNAVKFGLLSSSLKGIDNPILVRIRTDNNVSVSEVTDSTKGGAQLSTAEQALQDSKKLKDSTLAKYEQNRLGTIDNAKNAEFVRAVFQDIIPEDELNAYTTTDGSLSKSGRQRAVNAILAKAYGADPVLFNLVESTDEAYGKIGDALIAAAPTIAKLKALASNQTLFDVDLAGEILKAIKFVSNAKANNMAVFDAVSQQSMFADYNVDELTKKLALFIDNNKGAKWKNIVDMVTVSADVIAKKGSPLQGNVFGEEVKAPTAEEVLTTAINRVTNGEATAIIRMNDEKGQIEIKFVGNVSESVKKKLAKAKFKLSLEEQMWHAARNAASMKVAKELGYEEQGGNNGSISIFDEEAQAERNAGETASTESNETEEKQPAESNQDEVKEAAEQPTKKSFFPKRNEQAEKEQLPQNNGDTAQGEKLNLPKGTTAEVSIVGDNSNIIQVKFNGEQGKGTGGIMGRAGYKWKNDKQLWQARKTDKAMDVAEQLGYKPTEEMSEDKSQQTDKYKNYSKEDIKINKERLATMPDVDGILQPAAKKFAEFFKARFPKSDYTNETVDFWNNYTLEFEQLNKILKKYRKAVQQGNLSMADAHFQQISSSFDRINDLLEKIVGNDKEMRQEFVDSITPVFDEYHKIVDEHNAKDNAKKTSKAKKQQGKQEYKYYLNARPADIGAIPKGFIRVDAEDKGGRYGAIYYDRQLSDKEVQQYELKSDADVAKEKAQTEAVKEVSRELLKSDKVAMQAKNNTLEDFTLAYYDNIENYLADHIEENPVYADLLNDPVIIDKAIESESIIKNTYEKLRGKSSSEETTDKLSKNNKTADKQEAKQQKSNYDYGDKKAILKDLLAATGLKEKNSKVEDVEGLDYSDAGLEEALNELAKECSKLSANPMFNPALYRAAAKVGLIFLKRTGRNFKRWAKALLDWFRKNRPEEGEKIKPFLGAIYKNIENWPKDLKFKEDIVELSCRLVGSSYAEGNTSFEAVYRDIVDMAGEENAQALRGYLEQAYLAVDELENPTLTLDENVVESKQDKGGSQYDSNSTESLFSDDTGFGNTGNEIRTTSEGKEPRGSNGQGSKTSERESERNGNSGVPGSRASAGGKTSVREGSQEASSTDGDASGSTGLSDSVVDSLQEQPNVNEGAVKNIVESASDGRVNATDEVTQKVNEVIKENNLDKRRADRLQQTAKVMPFLTAIQLHNTDFVAERFDTNGKQGVMITDGTGTGKTFSGLAIVKKMVGEGKKNIIIAAPNDTIINQWIESARDFYNLEVTRLKDTDDAGEGIVITTYANFGENEELVNRNWDMVICDESHNLMNSESGKTTNILSRLRLLTYHPTELRNRAEQTILSEDKIEARKIVRKALALKTKEPESLSAKERSIISASERIQANSEDKLTKEETAQIEAQAKEWEELNESEKPKVMFLSATPFAYVNDIDYANGYLFDYPKLEGQGYNQPNGLQQFLMEHFGYRMRYNKLTKPDGSVDNALMEMEFHEWLRNTGALTGHELEIDKDYNRGFILVDQGVGRQIDEGFEFLRENKEKYGNLEGVLNKQFDGRRRNYLLESIKARASVPIIREYLETGKKVVVFHETNVERESFNPFRFTKETIDWLAIGSENAQQIKHEWDLFAKERPDLVNLNLDELSEPRRIYEEAFGDEAMFFNGRVPKKKRAQYVAAFNNDNSGKNLIIVQQDAGNAGISLHDTTGKHPRVEVNINIPRRPSFMIQIDGRIYRLGCRSNAIIRYLTTGTNIENNLFASTVAGRTSTAENLALGRKARGLRDSIIGSYQKTLDGTWVENLPGAEGEDVGGKESDRNMITSASDYDRAKGLYYGRGKKTAKTKAAEGVDYFATPEPIGYKMVQWANVKAGDKILEPSAGHGAISRFFSPTTENTIIEPSGRLAPQAQMNTENAKLINGVFEDLHISNKYDAITMNPPFGTGGKTAIEHLSKAFVHLREGGRVIALIPRGGMADKRFTKWYESDEAKNAHMVGEVLLPNVTFERAGTKVATRIVIIDKGGESQGVKRVDLSRINNINELFDNLESVEMPARQTKQTDVGAANFANSLRKGDAEGNSEVVTADSYKHTKTGEIIPSAKLNANLSDEEYRKVKSIAGKNGGYYSRYAKAFLFQDNESGRDKFVEEVNGANSTQYSVSSEAVQRAKEEVEAEIRAAFPNGKVEYVNGVPTITMPNGSKFQYSIRENIVVNAKEQRKADAAHGTSGARVQGFWKKFTGNGVQRMLAVSQNSERGTAFHEAMHAAIDLVLTEKEKNALYNYYEKKAKEQNRDVDEVIADAYRDWVLARQRKSGTMFGKLWRKVKDFCTRIKALFDKGAEVERIMQDVESGRVYKRGTNNHSVTKRISFSKEEIQGQKGSGTTQVATTRTMYVKALKWLRNQSPEAKTVLDYGAGLGLGTDDMRSNNPDLNIDCYEPNPERWAGKQPPTYTNNTQINKDYDLILNTNVLNVVEKPIRDLIVKDIADHLNMGGKALITTRGWSNDVNAAKNFKPADEHHAIWINKGKNGYVFQKGFDGDELKNYIEELLGDEFVVEKTRPTFGKASVTITRVKDNASDTQNTYSDTESINPNEDYIQGINDTDAAKVNTLAKSFEDKGYVGRPVVLVENGNEGYIAVTGSHRIEAAKQADVDLKAVVLENSDDTAQLIEARDDDERETIAKELYEEGIISKDVYNIIREENRSNGTHYSVASPKHKIANAFTNTERKGVVDSAKDFFKEHRKSLYQDWFDKNNPLKGFDALTKATGGLSVYDQVQSLPATTAGMLKALTEGTAQHVKMANQHLKNVKMKYNVTLAMALEKIDKKQMDKAYPKYLAENGFDNWVNALGAYLGAERCLEMAQLARAEGKTYKFPKGLTEQECQEFVKKAPQQFKAAADIFYKVNDNVISIMEDAEVFSHDLAKTLRTKYRKYCPLLRDFSDTAAADSFIGGLTEGGRGIGNVSVPLKRINIEGSERGVLNPLETILKSYAVMLNRAERNKVALMAVENSRTADLHELIQEVPGTTADPKNCVFTVLINGKKKAYKTTQDLYGPIVGYNLPAANLAFGVARTAARMLRTGATMSPSFILRNVLRDTVFAGVSSKNGFIPIVDTIRGAIALAKDPAMRAEFEAAGVTEYNFYSSQKSRIKSLDAMAGETPASAWEIMKAVFSRLEATSDFFESSTRMGEYMKARQKGLSMEEAARAAREVTLDFSRSGRIGEQVNQVVPFFNACLQGGDKMVRLFREDFVGTSQKVFKYIVLPSLLIMAMNWDEDWYKDLDPDIKNNYWCLGRNIRIPKPQEAGVLFGSGVEALFQQAADKDKDAVSNFLKAFSSNMIPSVLPTVILPLIEWSANYSFFKGRPLVGNKYSRLPDELQYNDYTSELSKGIGSALKVSPMKIDNLVRGYTGTMGALLWSMAGEPFAKANNLPAKHFSELPFVRDFNVTDANLSRPMNEFYGILDKANRQHAGYGVKGKPEAAVKGIRSAGSMISKIRKDIDKITHSNLTPERKRELIDKRKEKMNQIAKQANTRYGKYFD